VDIVNDLWEVEFLRNSSKHITTVPIRNGLGLRVVPRMKNGNEEQGVRWIDLLISLQPILLFGNV
jgi:hypothetical protein